MPPAARLLAEWAARLRPDDIPVTVRENAALRVLDTLGCALAGAREDHVPALLALLERSGEGPCTVVGSALTSGPAPAALVNGAMAHGLDFDDRRPGSTADSASSAPRSARRSMSGSVWTISATNGRRCGVPSSSTRAAT